MSYINTIVHITNNCFYVNKNKTTLDVAKEEPVEKALYRFLNLKYPKFHKMDKLSKIAFLGAEMVIANTPQIFNYNDHDIALLFANKESSLHTDLKFQNTLKNQNPSPSLFVYTLPNILLGEIAIKNKWYGENLFLILPKFDEKELTQQIRMMLQQDSVACLGGWVNVCEDELDAFFYFVEKNKRGLGIPLNEKELLKTYKSYEDR